MLTAFLSRAEVLRHTQALHLLRELREAFTRSASRPVESSAPVDVLAGTTVRVGSLEGLSAYSVSVKASGPTGTRAVLQLHERTSGKLLALMDAGHLLSLRASLMGALAVDVLAREDACNVAVLGTGPVVSSALKALRLVRSLERITLFDPDLAASTQQAFTLQTTLSASVRACERAEEAVALADLVVLTGPVVLPTDALRDGTHVTVMNAEGLTACPLPAAVVERARHFCDEQASTFPWAMTMAGGLGEVLRGATTGRRDARGVTVFWSTGPAFLDLLAAWHVYEGARHDEGLTRLDLEA